MSHHNTKGTHRRVGLLKGASMIAAAAMVSAPALAQDVDEEEAIVVTGTRITVPGVESASPIVTVGAEEIALMQEPEAERILRTLPSVVPADGQNVNNGSQGVATVNLRGLGAQRNLIMMDGRRLVPFGSTGTVDTQQIPAALIERVDVITGGASAVYGSDAISGAINFITRDDFEGVEFDYNRSITGEGDGEINSAALTLGANLTDGRGNVAVSMNYSERVGVTLGARPLGQLGIVTEDGSGYAEFLAGNPPAPPADPLCQAEGAVGAGGSTTTSPTRVAIPGSPALANAGLQQFRTDGSLGANCSVFNFNPYNYYQTPQERFGATAVATYEISPNVEAYGRVILANTLVSQQVAPSGIFGDTMYVNMDNPLIDAGVRAAMIGAAQAEVGNTIVDGVNWQDNDSSGTVTAADDLLLSIRRRTTEFGPRSSTFNTDTFQIGAGLRGEIGESGWDYDLYFSHGRVNTTQVLAGYSNVSHIADQVLTTDGVTCRDTSDPSCVPLNLFGPTITDSAAIAYGSATALLRNLTQQTIFSATSAGELPGLRSPWAASNVGVSAGYEYRWESAESIPDECLKLQPTSCLGGAGGVTLPLAGEYDVHELFAEAIIPIVEDQMFARSLNFELGYRRSDYSLSGVNETYKYGVNWEPIDNLRFRAMRQRAARAPNVNEQFSPIGTGLANATVDPCSSANAAAFPDPVLQARCESTGMTAGQVGVVADGVIAGQVNAYFGTDPNALPAPEIADTTTIGFVWSPRVNGLINNPVLSLDWYDIEIEDTISTFGAQEVLDGCYERGISSLCNAIVRVNGELGLPGAGVQLYNTNLLSAHNEGVELGLRFDVDLGGAGSLDVSFNGNHYLSQDTQSATLLDPIVCLGAYGNQCGNPQPENRFVQRTTWEVGDFRFSYLWRFVGETQIEEAQQGVATFDQFEQIDAYNYFDLSAGWNASEHFRFSASVRNVTEEEPPVVGNEAGTTSTNSGNTFPSVYDTLGRVFVLGFNASF